MPYSNIDKPSKYFNTVTYSGNGVNPTSITSVGFKPDLLWIKCRSNIVSNLLFDAVRGVSKRLISNSTATETTETQIASFDTNGWTMDADTANNGSGRTYVAWNWLASNTAGSSNTSGTISSTVSANTTSGFSIVSYTGTGTTSQTVGHGLGVAPAMIIIKNRSAVTDWRVYHKSLGVNGSYPNFLELDLTTASNTGDSGNFASVPTSSVFGVGNYNVVNGNGNSMIAYCFAEVKGFSKAFSYTGNGSTDGTFVYTGFMPKFIMIKRTDSADNPWAIYDTVRDTNNPNTFLLRANASNAEADDSGYSDHDHLSNGFKLRQTWSGINASGGTYIGIAFASNPFVSSKGIPTCAV